MKKLFSVMLAMLIFAFSTMAAPTTKAAIKKAPFTCCLIPPAPDVNVQKAKFIEADILFRNGDPNGVALKEAAVVDEKTSKDKINTADDSSPRTNDAKNNFDEKIPAVIPLK